MQPPTMEEIEQVTEHLKDLRNRWANNPQFARTIDIEMLGLRCLKLTLHSLQELEGEQN